MEEENMDNQDSLNLEGEQDTIPENESYETSEELAKAKEYANNQKIRAEKAERELKALRSKQSERETPKNDETKEKSNEPDYNTERLEKIILKTEGIVHPDDQKFVLDTAKRLKVSVDEVLQEEYIKAKLKSAQTQREAESGMPSGSGKGSAGSARNSVDYWVDKKKADGTYDTPEDLELAAKVINARLKKEEARGKFSEISFTG